MNLDPWDWITYEREWGGQRFRDLRPWFVVFSVVCWVAGFGLMLFA